MTTITSGGKRAALIKHFLLSESKELAVRKVLRDDDRSRRRCQRRRRRGRGRCLPVDTDVDLGHF